MTYDTVCKHGGLLNPNKHGVKCIVQIHIFIEWTTLHHLSESIKFYAGPPFAGEVLLLMTLISLLRWMIPPMVVHPEKIDFRRFV